MATKKQAPVLIKKLFSEDDDVVIEAISDLKDKGDDGLVEPLLELLLTNPAYSVSLAITDLLSNMKHKAAIEKFAELVVLPKYQPLAHHTLSILWNSNFSEKANAHLSRIVEMGLKGDYATLFEALTLIENLVPPFDEAQLLDGISQCKTFIGSNKGDDRLLLVKQLADILSDLDNRNSDIPYDQE